MQALVHLIGARTEVMVCSGQCEQVYGSEAGTK